MWLAAVRNSFSNSSGGTFVPAIEYVDVGHVTTSTNSIAAFWWCRFTLQLVIAQFEFKFDTALKYNVLALLWLHDSLIGIFVEQCNVVILLSSYD